MNLYLLTQSTSRGYDTYDSCVVCAPDRDAARLTFPREGYEWRGGAWRMVDSAHISNHHSWAKPENVVAIELGTANEALQPGVVCASFNAG